jgi:hypothetical protein
MKSRILSRNIKTVLYKTLIRPVLTYGAETRVLSTQDQHRLSILSAKSYGEFMAQLLIGEDGELELTKNSIGCVIRMTLWNSAS